MRYYAVEPWGFPVRDLWHGILTSTVANAAGATLKPEDFMLGEKPEPPEPDAGAQVLQILGLKRPPAGSVAPAGPRTEQGSPFGPAADDRPRPAGS